MRENSTARPRYVLFTIALELPVTDSKEAAEMRGYNWLARRLRPRYARSSDAELLSFNTVAVDAEKLRYAPEGGTESAHPAPALRLHRPPARGFQRGRFCPRLAGSDAFRARRRRTGSLSGNHRGAGRASYGAARLKHFLWASTGGL